MFAITLRRRKNQIRQSYI